MTKRNAIILAAGTASRFVPLSAERPKGLLEVKGEILIERQIRQLKEAGVDNIIVVVGYKAEMFGYLQKKFGVKLEMNEDYARYNNTSSVIRVLDYLGNTYVCSSDNYFPENVFIEESSQSYYSALYADGCTKEYCLTLDSRDNIIDVSVGGMDAWYMVGHVFFSEEFSLAFKKILMAEYEKEEAKLGYWEDVYIKNIDRLPLLKVHKYKEHDIEEFDSIDELRQFDKSYICDTRSTILKSICKRMGWKESDINSFSRIKHEGDHLLFSFRRNGLTYCYNGHDNSIVKL